MVRGRTCLSIALAALVWLGLGGPAPGAEDAPVPAPPARRLAVGVVEAPVFAMRGPGGAWTGLAVDLWRALAQDLGLVYDLRPVDLPELLDRLRTGELDVGVTALTLSAERERFMDFTHPFFHGGLGIAVPKQAEYDWLGLAWQAVTSRPAAVVGLMFLAMLLAGAVVWWVERRRNPDHFGGDPVSGLGSGLWWAAQTMTTVGYGDKAPSTPTGRLVAILWMLVSLVLVAIFSAVITSSLTVLRLEGKVRGLQDLDEVRVGVVIDSPAEAFLSRKRLSFRRYPDLERGLNALAQGGLDAFVHDHPHLRYLANIRLYDQIAVLPDRFDNQGYAFGLANHSPLREPLNQAMLHHLDSEAWRHSLYQYLGQYADR